MSAFIHTHYGICLISAIFIGLVASAAIILAIVRRASRTAIGRGLNW